MTNEFKKVYQFKITLQGIEPKIWRQIQVPENYNFFDLHLAIQYAMGWSNSHLHQFTIINPKDGKKSHIGQPSNDETFIENFTKLLDEKENFIRDYFFQDNFDSCSYEYNFSKDWEHNIKLEKILSTDPDLKYPICIDGKRACPPEECGGTDGYEKLLKIINNPNYKEDQDSLEWLDKDFDPEDFNPQNINFYKSKDSFEFLF